MLPSSRTPEGEPLRCFICGAENRVLVSFTDDSVCPSCGAGAWWSELADDDAGVLAGEIEFAKQVITLFIGHLAQKSRTESLTDLSDFYLRGITDCLAAHGAVLWLGRQPRWWQRRQSPHLFRSHGFEDNSDLALKVLQTGQPQLFESHAPPKPLLLIGVPLLARGQVVGVIELAQRIRTSPTARRGYVHFLKSTADVIADSGIL